MADLSGPSWGPKSGGAARQLVVLCHGLGADGFDLIDLAPSWGEALPDAAFVAPHAPFPCDMGSTGRQWFSVADRTPSRMLSGVRGAAEALDQFLDTTLARRDLPADAYALMGFSQGAMTALFAGLRRAVPPRAILAVSGALIAPETLAGEIRHRVPVLLVHGEATTWCPYRARAKPSGCCATPMSRWRPCGAPIWATASIRPGSRSVACSCNALSAPTDAAVAR